MPHKPKNFDDAGLKSTTSTQLIAGVQLVLSSVSALTACTRARLDTGPSMDVEGPDLGGAKADRKGAAVF